MNLELHDRLKEIFQTRFTFSTTSEKFLLSMCLRPRLYGMTLIGMQLNSNSFVQLLSPINIHYGINNCLSAINDPSYQKNVLFGATSRLK